MSIQTIGACHRSARDIDTLESGIDVSSEEVAVQFQSPMLSSVKLESRNVGSHLQDGRDH